MKKTVGRVAGDLVSLLPASGVTGAVALVGATGVALGVGIFTVGPGPETQDTSANVPASSSNIAVTEALAARAVDSHDTSRSFTRPALVSVQRADKSTAMPVTRQSVSGGVNETVAASDPRDIAMLMLPEFGWSSDEFPCLDQLYENESGWNPLAVNSTSGATGIPQALPGDKMAVNGSDWATNPETQLEWGMGYIQDRYGSPCGAWSFWESNGWY